MQPPALREGTSLKAAALGQAPQKLPAPMPQAAFSQPQVFPPSTQTQQSFVKCHEINFYKMLQRNLVFLFAVWDSVPVRWAALPNGDC